LDIKCGYDIGGDWFGHELTRAIDLGGVWWGS